MARPRIRTDALANDITDAAVELVRHRGLADLTTRAVAQAAATNIAALHQLFGSRDGLIDAVALHGFDGLAASMRHRAEAVPAKKHVLAYAQAFRDFARENPGLVEVMFARPITVEVPGDSGAYECRQRITTAVSRLRPTTSATAVESAALGLMGLLEGLALKERNGLLGSTIAQRDATWQVATDAYVVGLEALPPAPNADLDGSRTVAPE